MELVGVDGVEVHLGLVEEDPGHGRLVGLQTEHDGGLAVGVLPVPVNPFHLAEQLETFLSLPFIEIFPGSALIWLDLYVADASSLLP